MHNILLQEVEANFKAFQEVVYDLTLLHLDEFALMKNGKIVQFFSTMASAVEAGDALYSDRIFSVQKLTTTPEYLGSQGGLF